MHRRTYYTYKEGSGGNIDIESHEHNPFDVDIDTLPGIIMQFKSNINNTAKLIVAARYARYADDAAKAIREAAHNIKHRLERYTTDEVLDLCQIFIEMMEHGRMWHDVWQYKPNKRRKNGEEI